MTSLEPRAKLPVHEPRGAPEGGLFDLFDLPIVGAPLAGGPSTPELAAAVSEAGGLGFLAAGYKPAAATGIELERLRQLTRRPVGLNLFFPLGARAARRPRDRDPVVARDSYR